MTAARTLSLVTLGTLIGAVPALAQTGGFFQPVSLSPDYSVEHSHSSTAYEGALRGQAKLVEAVGRRHVYDAQARILNEQARTLDYENDVKRTETLYRKQYLWRTHREEERVREAARDAAGKELLAQRQATYYRDTYRLDSDELQRGAGKLTWPESLQHDQFAATRGQIDFLFRQRARYGATTDNPFTGRILKLTEQLKQDLKEQIADMDPEAYANAQKFVRGLIYEVQYPAQLS